MDRMEDENAGPGDNAGIAAGEAALLETPSGRAADSGAHPGSRLDEELRNDNAPPFAFDDLAVEAQSDTEERADGFDELEEEVRHAAEDVPSREEDRRNDLPVFETGLTGPRV